MKGYNIVNLQDMIDELGEDRVKAILLTFSSIHNRDVEYFLHKKAIEFSRQSISRTHLVFASFKSKPVLVGYFSLSAKYIMISKNALSTSLRKRITKFGHFERDLKKYVINAPLIGQLGKNYTYKDLITGDELLKMACDKVKEIQLAVGGKVVYLECEDHPKLVEFYLSNGFVNFGKRKLDSDELDLYDEENYLLQMLKYLK